MLLRDLVRAIGGEVRRGPHAEEDTAAGTAATTVDVRRVAPVDSAGPGDITLAMGAADLRRALSSGCSAVIVPESLLPDSGGGTAAGVTGAWIISSRNARLSFARAIEVLHPRSARAAGVHTTAWVAQTAILGKGVSVGPLCVVGDGCRLGDRVEVGPGTVLEDGVVIGEDTRIGPNVTIGRETTVGKRCVIQAGAVIGSEGFGFVETPEGTHHRVPQIGRVILEDDVEIGANTCVDRATLAVTVIGRGTKIDNLVQVAHNVRIGRNVVIAGCSGIGGSVVVGDGVKIGGGAGIVDHVVLGEGCSVGAMSLVATNVPAGAFFSGSPAREHSESLRIQAATRKLPDLLRALSRKVEPTQEP